MRYKRDDDDNRSAVGCVDVGGGGVARVGAALGEVGRKRSGPRLRRPRETSAEAAVAISGWESTDYPSRMPYRSGARPPPSGSPRRRRRRRVPATLERPGPELMCVRDRAPGRTDKRARQTNAET